MLTEAPVPPAPTSHDSPTSPSSTPESKPAGEKGSNKFAKGNPGGPGNPYARQTAALRKAIHEAVTTETIQRVCTSLVEMAENGNLGAARLLFQYAVGKPLESRDPDNLDLEEWQLFRQGALRAEETGNVVNSLPVSHVLQLCRAMIPIVGECLIQELVKGLRGEASPLRPTQPDEEIVI